MNDQYQPGYDARQPGQPDQPYGQGYDQSPWQPQPYDPQLHQQRLAGGNQGGYQDPNLGGYQGDYRNARADRKAAKARAKALRPWYAKKRTYVLGIFALIVITIIAVNAGGGSSTPNASAPTTPASAPSAPASSAPAAPSMTVAQQQAVDAAQEYLSMGSGFSYESLLSQLTSSSGDGFSQADAKFAINYLHPDWDAQAVDAAKGYMAMGGFSAASLEQQLTSSYGDGFTTSQAEYAVKKVGL